MPPVPSRDPRPSHASLCVPCGLAPLPVLFGEGRMTVTSVRTVPLEHEVGLSRLPLEGPRFCWLTISQPSSWSLTSSTAPSCDPVSMVTCLTSALGPSLLLRPNSPILTPLPRSCLSCAFILRHRSLDSVKSLLYSIVISRDTRHYELASDELVPRDIERLVAPQAQMGFSDSSV